MIESADDRVGAKVPTLDPWPGFRQKFPAATRAVYADAAAIGVMPQAAALAASDVHQGISDEGTPALIRSFRHREVVREKVARFFDASSEDVGFTDSTSTSMNLLAQMARQEWEQRRPRRDRVDMLRDEFPSSTLGWLHAGFEPVWVEPDDYRRYQADAVLDAVDERTRAIVCSMVQYRTGSRLDVKELKPALAEFFGEEAPWLVVNATQAATVLPVAFQGFGIDALCVTGLKWLCSGPGNGILCVSEAIRRSRIPVRSTIHSSFVSTISSRSALVKTRSGKATPVPTMANGRWGGRGDVTEARP